MTADRFKLQQSWWLASELGRRHQGVWVERFISAQSGPVLAAYHPDGAAKVYFDLQHGVRVHLAGSQAEWGWESVFSAMGAHDLLKRIEASSGLGTPRRAPATSAQSLVYRLIARLLAVHVDAPRPWVPVPVEVQPMVRGLAEPSDDALLAGFDTVHDDILNHRADGAARFDDVQTVGIRPWLWAMTRDVETAFMLDTDGYVHTRAVGVRSLLKLYDELGRDIDRLAVHVLELAGVTRA
ncbi:MAG: hypothetical protein ACQEWM_03755 [Actinomycetota bacterium]